ncbi:MAG TPA: ATP-binding protein, partial [Gammaproteobacteria bacterium]|nr:ATP-binding protein [Gammaproteobacteria bacterium]
MAPPHPPHHPEVDFRRVFEASLDHYALVAPDPPDFTVLAASEGYVRLTLKDRDELLGCSIFTAFPQNPADTDGQGQSILRDSFETVIRERRIHGIGTFRYDIPDQEGRFIERYWSPRNIPILDEDGRLIYILHRVDEVTDFVLRERLQTREASSSTEIPRGKRLLIAEADPGRGSYLEQLFATQWQVEVVPTAGEALERIRREPPDMVFSGMDLPDLGGDDLVRTLRKMPVGGDLPVILAVADANPRQFRQAFEAGANEVVSGQASARELIARGEAQMAAAELHRTLPERTRELYHQLFMQAPIAIALMEGIDHVYTLSNPAHDELADQRPLLGRTAREAFPEPGLEEFFERLDQVYATGKPFTASEAFAEFRAPGSVEATPRYLTFAYLPVNGLKGEIVGVAAFVQDVTGEVEARKALEREGERKDEFLSLLAHELRNPLTPIANAAQLLDLKAASIDPEQLNQVSSLITRQITHLTRIVDDLLDLSRIDQGRITLQKETVDLRELVPQAVESIADLREGRTFDFSVDLPDSPLTVYGDPVRLTQVLANLLDNAAKYTPGGGWIRLEGHREGERAVLRVRDNGAGMDPSFLPKLFKTFERGPNRDTQVMGLGLGLPLVKRLLRLHGGTVEAWSPGPGMGSTFTVRLPARAPETTGGTDEAAPLCNTAGQILIAEDNEDVAGSLRFLLEALGQKVRRAANGQEALEAIRSFRPALVLLDIGLPDMTGFEVA